MAKTASVRASLAWLALTVKERQAFVEGRLGRTEIVRRFGEAFNTTEWGRGRCTTAWSHLVRLADEWRTACTGSS